MSRAFVKETDGEEQDPAPAPPAGPIRVTPGTLAAWRAELDEAEETARRLRDSEAPEDRLDLANAKRRAAVLRARIEAAVVAEEPARDPGEAGFGSAVEVAEATGRRWRFVLVGGEEADPAAGRISWRSPLGEALMGARAGDTVAWHRQGAEVALTVLKVEPQG